MGGREERKKIACLLSLRRRRLPSVPSFPLSLRRRRQRCLRPLNPALERERTKEGENEGDRKEEDRQGREREREERKEAPILAWLYRSSDSPPLRSFSRRLIASVGPAVGRSVGVSAAAAPPADWSNLYSRAVKLSCFFMAPPSSLALSIRTNEGGPPHLSTSSWDCSARLADIQTCQRPPSLDVSGGLIARETHEHATKTCISFSISTASQPTPSNPERYKVLHLTHLTPLISGSELRRSRLKVDRDML